MAFITDLQIEQLQKRREKSARQNYPISGLDSDVNGTFAPTPQQW